MQHEEPSIIFSISRLASFVDGVSFAPKIVNPCGQASDSEFGERLD